MKTRITLTIDPGVSHRAKDVARREGLSLSALVEKMLASVTDDAPQAVRKSFSQRWKGRMKIADAPDDRGTRLKAKYKLGE